MRTVMVVVGATGQLGLAICRRLRAQGLAVRALVRHGSPKERDVRDLGVEVVHGDLKDPSSLEPLCHDAAAVISTAKTIGAMNGSLGSTEQALSDPDDWVRRRLARPQSG